MEEMTRTNFVLFSGDGWSCGAAAGWAGAEEAGREGDEVRGLVVQNKRASLASRWF